MSSKTPQKKQVETDDNPAVQLYQLVMRAVRESSSVFSVAEKKVLRNLLVRPKTTNSNHFETPVYVPTYRETSAHV